MSKKIFFILISIALLLTAFSPMTRKRRPPDPLPDVAFHMLVRANDNRGEMQTCQWKQYTFYMRLEHVKNYQYRDVYTIGVSRVGRSPGMNIFNRWRNAFPRVSDNIENPGSYKERKGKNYFIWSEITIGYGY
ncbi:MAG: hypothetical protein JW908_00480 [Anaerolineales bacterium]|nr:hypothetical protein [Anaerolineales bacterium]